MDYRIRNEEAQSLTCFWCKKCGKYISTSNREHDCKKIQEGDEVKLKSGSPKMVVEYIDGDAVETTWFDSSNREFKFEQFNKKSLTKDID